MQEKAADLVNKAAETANQAMKGKKKENGAAYSDDEDFSEDSEPEVKKEEEKPASPVK